MFREIVLITNTLLPCQTSLKNQITAESSNNQVISGHASVVNGTLHICFLKIVVLDWVEMSLTKQ